MPKSSASEAQTRTRTRNRAAGEAQPVTPSPEPPARTRKAQAATGIAALKPNAKNPRKAWQGEAQKEAFKKSLLTFGDLSGIVFNATSKQLVGGHKRVDEFKAHPDAELVISERLKQPDVCGTIAFGHVILPNGVRFAYREVLWDKSTEMAANLAANRWAAEWEWAAVSDMFRSLQDDKFDLNITGFDLSEIEPLIEADWTPGETEPLPETKESDHEPGDHAHTITLDDEALKLLNDAKEEFGTANWSDTIKKLCLDNE